MYRASAAIFCLLWISDMTAVLTSETDCPDDDSPEIEEPAQDDATVYPWYTPPACDEKTENSGQELID